MKPPDKILNPVRSGKADDAPQARHRISPWFGVMVFVLVAGFGRALYDLVRFSMQNDLYSHIILVPFISLYLLWINRQTLPPPTAPDHRIAGFLLVAGCFALTGRWIAIFAGVQLAREDSLALTILSFLLFFSGICGWYLGRSTLRAIAFPLCFLACMMPLPILLQTALETCLQHGSADVAYAMLRAAGTPVFREGLVFQLPGITLEVAPQCSGIHSTLALFITSLLAGYLFLRTAWKRTVLALAVIPLAILRNGLRIFTIGELCVHISPDMINSYIHHHGGPVFFMISLIPFSLLLGLLVKSDRPGKDRKNKLSAA